MLDEDRVGWTTIAMAARKFRHVTVNSEARPTGWGAHANLRQAGMLEPRTRTLEPRPRVPPV